MNVTLSRRWGQHRAGESVDVSDSQGQWLIQHNYAESAGDIVAPVQVAAAPGAHGPDPLAGGDATRLRPRVPRSEGSTAAQAPGSSPTYRAGFTAEDAANQGDVGRAAPAADEPSASDEKPTRRKRASK